MTKGQDVTGEKKDTTGRGKRAMGRPARLYMPSWGTAFRVARKIRIGRETGNTHLYFFGLMLLIFMLMNFNPLIKLLLFVPEGEDLSFFSFVRGINLFSVSKFTCSPKNESEKLKNSHFGQIHVQFVLFSFILSFCNE